MDITHKLNIFGFILLTIGWVAVLFSTRYKIAFTIAEMFFVGALVTFLINFFFFL